MCPHVAQNDNPLHYQRAVSAISAYSLDGGAIICV